MHRQELQLSALILRTGQWVGFVPIHELESYAAGRETGNLAVFLQRLQQKDRESLQILLQRPLGLNRLETHPTGEYVYGKDLTPVGRTVYPPPSGAMVATGWASGLACAPL